MPKAQINNPSQLSLFEAAEPSHESHEKQPTSVMEFLKKRVEKGPEMTPEEYRRWIKILIHQSLKSIE